MKFRKFRNQVNFVFLILFFSVTSFTLNAAELNLSEQHTFEGLVQHYCYVSYNFFMRVGKIKNSALHLADQHEKIMNYAYEKFHTDIDIIRDNFYSSQQEKAVTQLVDHLLHLCNKFNLKNYLFKFPENSSQLTVEKKFNIGKRAQKALENYYESIKPHEPFLKQLENRLLYNFFSTRILPITLRIVGSALSTAWLTYSLHKEDASKFNPLQAYKEIEHDSPRYDTSIFIKLGEAIANAVKIPIMTNVKRTRIVPCEQEEEEGHICNGGGNLCYQNTGFELNPTKLIPQLAPYMRFMLPYALFHYLARVTKSYQLPEYTRRIEAHNKSVERKKIEQEQLNLKVQYEKEIGFADIKGQQKLIDKDIRLIVDYLKHGFKYKRKTGSLSLLLYGSHGNGKTLLARAIAKESGAPFFEITADEILHPDAKEKILAVWRMAEKVAAERPEKSAIIYIDEIDNVVGNRINGQLDPARAKALANLLSILDGIEKRNPYLHIVIIICTNHHKNLDPALMRPGRIDLKINITVPNEQGRQEFFDALIPESNKHLIPDLIARTAGLSGAEIESLVTNAQMTARYNNRMIPSQNDYLEALASILRQKDEIITK